MKQSRIATMYYIVNRRWMNKSFSSFTEAYAYAQKRITDSTFTFRKILVFDYTTKVSTLIDNIHGVGGGHEVSSSVKFTSTDADINRLLAEEA